ncbi:MAG: L-aspartate oxidase [Deltaproteobacteria bacterium]|nr:L-aspartate oxidase [Deltaproteobacteria bacterium]
MDVFSDFLIIGSGIAGLSCALRLARHGKVSIITKKSKLDASTNFAQGGIAAVLGLNDSFDLHVKDTLEAGDGLCHEDVVKMVVERGPRLINELVSLGVDFKTAADTGSFDLGREGGHSRNRIVHALDVTGREVEKNLINRAEESPNITFYENHMAVDLLTRSRIFRRGAVTTESEDTCWGAYVLDAHHGRVDTFVARFTIICTGGAGKVYLYTSNPDIAGGDGMAIGFRAGVKVANMEFVQFHPTCLFHPHAKNFLISEAVRGEGGRLMDAQGCYFMEKYHPRKDLAARDIVARAIDRELKKSGADCVYLDITHRDADYLRSRFPNIYQTCLSYGIDITKDPIPVVPAAHYMCGGLVADLSARTNVNRLYAVGEAACTGLHGANRLASNSLLEALVFAEAAYQDIAAQTEENKDLLNKDFPSWDPGGATDSDESVVVTHNWDEIRRTMWNYVGIVRTTKRLIRAKHRIDNIRQEIDEYYWDFLITRDLLELRNLATVADLIVRSALIRKESRGLHYMPEYPQRDDENWSVDTVLSIYDSNHDRYR